MDTSEPARVDPWTEDMGRACAAGDTAALQTLVFDTANRRAWQLLPLVFNHVWDHEPEQLKTLSEWILDSGWWWCLLQASTDGDLAKVQWLTKKANKRHKMVPIDFERCIDRACCMGGHLHVAEWLLGELRRGWGHDVIVYPARSAVQTACKQGFLHVVQWLMPLVPKPVAVDVKVWLYDACCGGHLHVVKWLCAAHKLVVRNHKDAFVAACVYGHVAIARWFMDQADPEWTWPEVGIRHLQTWTWSASRDTWMRAVVRIAKAPTTTGRRTARAASLRKSGRG